VNPFKKIFGKKKVEKEEPVDLTGYTFNPDDYLNDLITAMRSPWVDSPLAWRKNNDINYLTKVFSNGIIGRFIALRESFAVTKSYRLDFTESDAYFGTSDIDHDEVEKLIRRGFSLTTFDIKFYLSIIFKSVGTGLEGAFIEQEKVDDLWCPSNVYHIDNRRLNYYRTGTIEDNRVLGIKDAVGMLTRPFTEVEEANTIISLFRPFEWTLGYGEGFLNRLYQPFRFLAFLEELIQIFAERFTIPFIAVSAAQGSAATGGTNAGKKLKELLLNNMDVVNSLRAGGIFALPEQVMIQLLDVGKGKLEELRELYESIQKQIGDVVLGVGEAVTGSSKTYGAARAQTDLSLQFIFDDREFLEDKLQLVLERFFYLNRDKFNALGIKHVNQLPKLRLVYEQPDLKTEIEKFKVLTDKGYVYTDEDVESKFEVDLQKDEEGNLINTMAQEQQEPEPALSLPAMKPKNTDGEKE